MSFRPEYGHNWLCVEFSILHDHVDSRMIVNVSELISELAFDPKCV